MLRKFGQSRHYRHYILLYYILQCADNIKRSNSIYGIANIDNIYFINSIACDDSIESAAIRDNKYNIYNIDNIDR